MYQAYFNITTHEQFINISRLYKSDIKLTQYELDLYSRRFFCSVNKVDCNKIKTTLNRWFKFVTGNNK